MTALAAAAVIIAVLLGGGVWLASRPPPAPELRLDIATPPNGGAGTSTAVSPDGTRVVFSA
jgi:hypothetical protein